MIQWIRVLVLQSCSPEFKSPALIQEDEHVWLCMSITSEWEEQIFRVNCQALGKWKTSGLVRSPVSEQAMNDRERHLIPYSGL